MSQSFNIMEMDANELVKRMTNIEKDLSKVLDLLGGNGIDKKDQGLVGDVGDHDERITSLEKKVDRFFWTLIGMGLPAGIGVLKILQEIIRSFKN